MSFEIRAADSYELSMALSFNLNTIKSNNPISTIAISTAEKTATQALLKYFRNELIRQGCQMVKLTHQLVRASKVNFYQNNALSGQMKNDLLEASHSYKIIRDLGLFRIHLASLSE
jgi:hypothetical protein